MIATAEALAQPGERLGGFRLQRLLMRHGNSEEWLAEGQDHRPGSVWIASRRDLVPGVFPERLTLYPALQHPHLAITHAAGQDARGNVYIAAEAVEGEPLIAYCESRRLPLRERMRLFERACAVVSHLHAELVAHGGLRPESIRVQANGEIRLTSLGLTGLLRPGAVDESHYTSPEQCQGHRLTAPSDVYSLGIILCELVTGWTPEEGQGEAALRVKLAELRGSLNADVEAIILTAVRTNPRERYRSAELLRLEVERHLRRQPVEAVNGGVSYRVGKFFRRRPSVVAGLSAAGLALCLLAGALRWQNQLENRQFQQSRKLARAVLFDLQDQLMRIPGTDGALTALRQSSLEYLDAVSANRAQDPAVLAEAAAAYEKLAASQGGAALGRDPGKALELVRRACDLRSSLAAAKRGSQRDLGACWNRQAHLERGSGAAEYGATAQRAVEALERGLKGTPADQLARRELADALQILAAAQREDGQETAALQTLRRCATLESELWSAGALEGRSPAAWAGLVDTLVEFGRLEEANQALDGEVRSLVQGSAVLRPIWLQRSIDLAASSDRPSYGERIQAAAQARELVALYESRAAASPLDPAARQSLASALSKYGYLTMEQDPLASFATLRRALDLYTELLAREPLSEDLREGRQVATLRLAIASCGLQRCAESALLVDQTVREIQSRSPRETTETDRFRDLAKLNLATSALERSGLFWRAGLLHDQARVRAAELEDRIKGRLAAAIPIADAYEGVGRHLVATGHPGEGRVWFERSRKLWAAWTPQNQFASLRQKRAESTLAPLAASR
jgi:non-specific serine/threonine protein kinase/serine/threonine-protein kinase